MEISRQQPGRDMSVKKSFKKEASRLKIKREDEANIYAVLFFQDDDNEWHRIKLAIPKFKLEKV